MFHYIIIYYVKEFWIKVTLIEMNKHGDEMEHPVYTIIIYN